MPQSNGQFLRFLRDKYCNLRTFVAVAVPVACYGLSWFIMSCFLHLATMEYVRLHGNEPIRAQPLDDVVIQVLGHKDVPLPLLDIVAIVGMGGFILGSVWLRDVRLWAKVWYTGCLLFLLKGIMDYLSILPDSSGYKSCAKRITPDGEAYFKDMAASLYDGGAGGFKDFLGKFLKLEFTGITTSAGKRIFPVRYCSDMAISGHTFNLVVFFLGAVETILKKAHKHCPDYAQLLGFCAYAIMLAAMAVEAYLILVKHFHYTADVMQGALFGILVYSNPALTMFSKWFVDLCGFHKGAEENQGVIWVPGLLFPFCCFHGFYEIGPELHIDAHWPLREEEEDLELESYKSKEDDEDEDQYE